MDRRLFLKSVSGAAFSGVAGKPAAQEEEAVANAAVVAVSQKDDEVESLRKLFAQIDPKVNGQIKFSPEELAAHLTKQNHEAWRLVTYADPAYTEENPIADIGAGFNMRVKARPALMGPDFYVHNDRTRVEPSSDILWKLAGIPMEKFNAALEKFDARMKSLGQLTKYQQFVAFRDLHTNPDNHDITDEEARRLMLVSIRHAAHNAMAYVKDFPSMTKHQQMGLTELVYQMGSNFSGFSKTLAVLNDLSYRDKGAAPDAKQKHWQEVQSMLRQSQWYKKYTGRAKEVVSWFDPRLDEPTQPEAPQIKVLPKKDAGWLQKAKSRYQDLRQNHAAR